MSDPICCASLLLMVADAGDLLQIIRTHGANSQSKALLEVANSLEQLLSSQSSDLTKMHQILSEEQQQRKNVEQKLQEKMVKMAFLEEQLRIELARKYGKSSERYKPTELQTAYLFDEAEMILSRAPEESEQEPAIAEERKREKQAPAKNRGKREILPEDLQRITIEIDIREDQKMCSHCGQAKQVIGEQVSEQIQMKPIEFYVERTVRKTYACSCGKCGVCTPEAPIQVFPKSIMGDTVIAQVVTSKFCDSLPFYRQHRVLLRSGISISEQTMARGASRMAEVFTPLVDLIGQRLSECSVLCADETRLRVLKDNGIKKDGTSYMWVAAGENAGMKLVRFHYEDGSRSAQAAKELLGSFTGILMCDGYGAYPSAVKDMPITLAACMAHVRRRFNDVLKSDRKNIHAQHAMKMIQDLYKIERKAQGLSDEEILPLRQDEAEPLFNQFRDWLYQTAAVVLPKSALGTAVSYAVNLLPRLEQYLKNPKVPIDNNPAENAIRPFVVGRKNWLFSAESHGAKTSAKLYTLIESAKANTLEPMHYILFLLRCYRHFGENAMPWSDLLPKPDLRNYADQIGVTWGFG